MNLIAYEYSDNYAGIIFEKGAHLTPGLYKMAGAAEREIEGPETPPCQMQYTYNTSRQAVILPEQNDSAPQDIHQQSTQPESELSWLTILKQTANSVC